MKSTADAGNDVAVFVREFGATHSATMSSCERRFVKHFNFKFWRTIRYTEDWWIPVFFKYHVWFCDSLVHLFDSKSIHRENQSYHQCAHCDVVRFLNAFLYCQCFSIFL